MPKKTTIDTLKILKQIAGKEPAMQQMLEEKIANREVAQKIHQLREKAGLSQAALARDVSAPPSL